MRAASLAALAVALVIGTAACSGARTVPQPSSTASRGQDPDRAAVARWNRGARRGAVTERVHGLVVEDPFRALESDTELTRSWIAAQTDRTERALALEADPERTRRLRQLLTIGSLDAVAASGTRLFVARREGEREQAALYVIEDGKLDEQPLVDPLKWGERAAVDWFYVGSGGHHVAFGISQNGDERSQLRVIDVDRRSLLPEVIDHAKWSSLAWLADGSGFYYSRYPRPGEPGFDEAAPDSYWSRVFFHALGSDPARDPLVWQSDSGSDFPAPAASDDDRYVVVVNARGFTASDVHLLDRGAAPAARVNAPDTQHTFRSVVAGRDKLTSGVVHRGQLYLLTDIGAPRRRIVAAAPETASDEGAWRTIVPESAGTIEDFALFGQRLAVHRIEELHSRVLIYDLNGALVRELELPARGSVDSFAADPNGDTLAFIFSSFFYPPALFRYDGRTGALERVLQVENDLDLRGLTLGQASVRSADGTEVNVHYVHREPLVRDRNQPVLLYGYGGFDVALLPQFTRNALYFIERGGIYAVANLRGGGEFGEAWHRAGMLENKPRVFEDFEAVIRWFASSGISRPDRVAITGGSNGGLLCGALLARAPDAFRAAATYVGLYDMLRYTRFPPAEIWTSEYGDPREPDAARWLHGYSPYHRLRDGVRYPAALIETAQHDTRVSFVHSLKFAARLQEAQASPAPIYFYMERAQGHGRGTRTDDLVRRYDRMYAFLERELGMRAVPSRPD